MQETTRHQVGIRPVTLDLFAAKALLLALVVQWLVAAAIILGRPR